MKKKSLLSAIAILVIISISSAMTPCTDIFDACIDSNPFAIDEGLHEFQAHIGHMQGCLNFLDACFEQN